MTARAKDTSDAALAQTIRREVAKRVVSQEMMVERLLIGLLTGGHILLEGVPGLAKTLVVRTMAAFVTDGNAAGATATVSVNLELSPAAIAPDCVAVTIAPLCANVQPAPAPETKLIPDGSVSVTVVAPTVAAVPVFCTTNV